jgi:DNA polymerase-4
MPTESPTWVLHLDVDAFFASVEQRDDSRLRGRPVAVGTGVVASCSYEARRWGVTTAMRLNEARRRCPRLLVLLGDYRKYEQAGRAVLGICRDRVPRVEVAALDDLYLDMNGASGDQCQALGKEICEQVMAEVGLSLSMGLATNKLVAAVATDAGKRAKVGAGQLRPSLEMVPAGREREFLAPWPAEVLPGVGGKTRAELERLNVNRVEELAAVPLSVLCGLFGPRGRLLRDLALGIDPRPVVPSKPAQSVSRRTSFDPPACECAFLEGMLDHLVERAAAWLRVEGQAARGVTVEVRYGDYQSHAARTALREASAEEAPLRQIARERFARLYTRRLPLRLLGVELSPLVSPLVQGQLFDDRLVQRNRRLGACKDAIRDRFGFMAVVSGTSLAVAEHVPRDRENFRLRTPCLTR